MQIQLPSAADVTDALEIWRGRDPRLGHLLDRYGAAAPALRHYGLVLWEGGNLQASAQALTGAAALTPEDARVWSDLASVFHGLGSADQAVACAEESLARDPAQPPVWLQLGAIRSAAGDGPGTAEAYKRALDLDDGLAEAWVGLGLAYLNAKSFRAAIAPFQAAVQRGKANDPAVQGCLGQALYAVGDFEGAVAAFTVASTMQPDNRTLLLNLIRAQFVIDVINGSVEDATAAAARHASADDDFDKTLHDGFHLLSAFGHQAAAIRLGAYRLARAPDDRMQAYLLASRKGEAVDRAPDSYIVGFFDKFADGFDRKLVNVLGYKVPGELAALAQSAGRTISRVLDLGCGTGLVGPHLARPGRGLTGVDLSPRMLDKARLLGCYETLVEAEVVGFLTSTTQRYDLVVAADMLIYFGDLSAVFEGVARVLESRGLFALSLETSDDKTIDHLSSGRFAHSLAYVDRLAAATGFTVLEMRRTLIRLEADVGAPGALMLLARA